MAGDVLDHRFFDGLQAQARLAQHRLRRVPHQGLLAVGLLVAGNRCRQCGIQLHQFTSRVHQQVFGVVTAGCIAQAFVDAPGARALVFQAEDTERIRQALGDAGSFAEGLALGTGDTGLQRLPYGIQFFAQGQHGSTQCLRPHGQRIFGIRSRRARHGPVQRESFVESFAAGTVGTGKVDIEQQVAHQVPVKAGVQYCSAATLQQSELHIDTTQQLAKCRHHVDAVLADSLEYAQKNLPQGLTHTAVVQQRHFFGDLHQIGETLAAVDVPNQAGAGHVIHLAQLADQLIQLGLVRSQRLALAGKSFERRQIRREQRTLGNQAFAAHSAQVVQQRKQQYRVVAALVGNFFQVEGKLEQRAHQEFARLITVFDLAGSERLHQLLHFFGEHGGTGELRHMQTAVHLVDKLKAIVQQAFIGSGGIGGKGFQVLSRLRQRLVDFTRQPVQGQEVRIVVTHAKSSVIHSVRRCMPRTRTRRLATRSRRGRPGAYGAGQ